MKIPLYFLDGKEKGSVDLPEQFTLEQPRLSLIQAVLRVFLLRQRQPYGSDPRAGLRHSAELSRRRRQYRGSYGIGISRVPRKILSRSGTRFNWVGAFMPGTVGGRRAHPPKAEKILIEKVNIKERRRAIRSALAATIHTPLVAARGHLLSPHYPFILAEEFESVKKTKELQLALEKLALHDELARIKKKTVRAGRGTMRNRKYRRKVGPLIVVAHTCPLIKSSQNLNIDVVDVRSLNARHLAPGAVAGRLTLFTESAIDALKEEKLFA